MENKILNITIIILICMASFKLGFNSPKLIKIIPIERLFDYDSYSHVKGTGSMLPVISKNDILFYEEITKETDIKINDIVVYGDELNNQTIVHRVIYIDEDKGYLFKGDNNLRTDGFITRDKLLRKVVMIEFG